MSAKVYEPHKSSIGGLDANMMAVIAYGSSIVLSWIPGISYFAWLAPLLIFIIEKDSIFVKFHAMQAFILQLLGGILSFIVVIIVGGIIGAASYSSYTAFSMLGFTGIISLLIAIISLAVLAFTIIAVYNAYSYKEYKIPIIGNIADSLGKKLVTRK